MRVNIEFLVVTYFVALFIDWVFQFEWQASNKSKWNVNDDKRLSLKALLSHSLIYSLSTSIIVYYLLVLDLTQFTIIFIILLVSHSIIDTRIPVKAIMKFKGMSEEQINDITNYGFMHIGIDHRLHELVIFILSIFI